MLTEAYQASGSVSWLGRRFLPAPGTARFFAGLERRIILVVTIVRKGPISFSRQLQVDEESAMFDEFRGTAANGDNGDTADTDGDEWTDWYRLTPLERWQESQKLWEFYLAVGGSLDPEPDSQSPFGVEPEPRPLPVDGGAGLRVLRRGRV